MKRVTIEDIKIIGDSMGEFHLQGGTKEYDEIEMEQYQALPQKQFEPIRRR